MGISQVRVSQLLNKLYADFPALAEPNAPYYRIFRYCPFLDPHIRRKF